MRSSKRTIQCRAEMNQVASLAKRQTAPQHLSKPGVTPEGAEAAIGTIAQAMQEMALALDAASVATMYYIPARGAEPKEALRKLDGAKERLTRALALIEGVSHLP